MKKIIYILLLFLIIFSCSNREKITSADKGFKYLIYKSETEEIYFHRNSEESIAKLFFTINGKKNGYYMEINNTKVIKKILYVDDIPYLQKNYYWSKEALDSMNLYSVIDIKENDIYMAKYMSWNSQSTQSWFSFKYMPITCSDKADFIFSAQNTDIIKLNDNEDYNEESIFVNNEKFVLGMDDLTIGSNLMTHKISFMKLLQSEDNKKNYSTTIINVPLYTIKIKCPSNNQLNYWVSF